MRCPRDRRGWLCVKNLPRQWIVVHVGPESPAICLSYSVFYIAISGTKLKGIVMVGYLWGGLFWFFVTTFLMTNATTPEFEKAMLYNHLWLWFIVCMLLWPMLLVVTIANVTVKVMDRIKGEDNDGRNVR